MKQIYKKKRGAKKIDLWVSRRLWNLKAKVHDLNYFFWESTRKCNLSCRHCGSDCYKDEQTPELSSDQVCKVFHDLARSYDPEKIMVAVTGGEPLIRPDLFDVLGEVGRLRFSWGMVTNGMAVDHRVVEKCMETGMRTVVVSLDGLEESHNWLRNNAISYQKATSALQLFVNAKKFDVVEAITCVSYRNIGQLDLVYEQLRDLKVDSWRLFTIFPKGRAVYNPELLSNRELLIRLFEFIKQKRGQDPEWPVNYSEEGYLGCGYEGQVRDDLYYCAAGIHVGGLLCNGDYSACPSLSQEWVQGNANELTFPEAWETRYQNMRNRRWMENDFCGNCPEWKNCQGSSLHLWDWKHGRPKVCHFRILEGKN
jgi:radical SAM protein with 4Fe4S-binding SPASM domain